MDAALLTDRGRDIIFCAARTATRWQDRPVGDALLKEIYDLMRWGPTSANCCPLRIVFVRSPEAKERLKPALDKGNVEQTMSAPVTAIFAMDMRFHEHLPFLFPHTDAKSWFEGNEEKIRVTAFRNSTLQAAYFIIAARACGLDCGPMSGFDQRKVDEAFFPDGRFRSNFLCNLGYADRSKLYPRGPRFAFGDVCDIA